MTDKEYQDARLRLRGLKFALNVRSGITGELLNKYKIEYYQDEYFRLRKKVLEEHERRCRRAND